MLFIIQAILGMTLLWVRLTDISSVYAEEIEDIFDKDNAIDQSGFNIIYKIDGIGNELIHENTFIRFSCMVMHIIHLMFIHSNIIPNLYVHLIRIFLC